MNRPLTFAAVLGFSLAVTSLAVPLELPSPTLNGALPALIPYEVRIGAAPLTVPVKTGGAETPGNALLPVVGRRAD